MHLGQEVPELRTPAAPAPEPFLVGLIIIFSSFGRFYNLLVGLRVYSYLLVGLMIYSYLLVGLLDISQLLYIPLLFVLFCTFWYSTIIAHSYLLVGVILLLLICDIS